MSAPTESSETVLGTMSLSRSSELRFYVSQYRGRSSAQVRQYLDTGKYTGYTKKGIAVSLPVLDALVGALRDFSDTLVAPDETPIAQIPVSATETLVVRLIPPGDDDIASLDVREYVDAPEFVGWTRRGFRVSLDRLPTVLDLLRKCRDCLDRTDADTPSLFRPAGEDSHLPRAAEEAPAQRIVGGDIISGVLSAGIPSFPEDFTDEATSDETLREIRVPVDGAIIVGSDRRELRTKDGRTLCRVRSHIEARYVLYANDAGHDVVGVPASALTVFRAVKAYERFVADVRHRLTTAYESRTGHRETAEKLADTALEQLGLKVLGEGD